MEHNAFLFMKLKFITYKGFNEQLNKIEENIGTSLDTINVADLENMVLLHIEQEISSKKSEVPVFIRVDNDFYCIENYTKSKINGRECIVINTNSSNKIKTI